MSAESEYDK
jgi:hypothetical protein